MEQNLLFKAGQIVKYIILESVFRIKRKSNELFGNASRVYIQNGFIDYYDDGVKRHYSFIDDAHQYHRDDGPAKEWVDGRTQYWINGKVIKALDNKKIYGKENLAKYLTLV